MPIKKTMTPVKKLVFFINGHVQNLIKINALIYHNEINRLEIPLKVPKAISITHKTKSQKINGINKYKNVL